MPIDTIFENKSTKEVILNYLRKNKGREIAVHEISEKFDFKLNRISNAIKELELGGEINIERRPLKRGKFTVISLYGDTITQFASHDRELSSRKTIPNNINEKINIGKDKIEEIIEFLKSINYTQTKLSEMLVSKNKDFFSLVVDILQPTLYEVGQKWQSGLITVADEHLISSRLEKFIIDLIKERPKTNSKVILLAPVENETHTLSLSVLELLLVEQGFQVINLSRTLPVLSLIDFINNMKRNPDWIFFSITLEHYISNLKMDLKIIKKELGNFNIKIAIGGQGILKFNLNDLIYADKIIKSSSELHEFLLSI